MERVFPNLFPPFIRCSRLIELTNCEGVFVESTTIRKLPVETLRPTVVLLTPAIYKLLLTFTCRF